MKISELKNVNSSIILYINYKNNIYHFYTYFTQSEKNPKEFNKPNAGISEAIN